ncbi:PRS2-like protein [Burkholderia pseudomallei]|uniref:Mpo1 family 2-hydroxy fatty acid dioxygenase n=1 Tax=Burkholderia pseudomallei TaxID=28450 RepID=UPI00017229E6|nr:Mpo1-like protein [Burkholderia pseudomallei]EDS86355.1 putative membrane protein [Burkholderia pseudomallei S13]CAJ9836045.1 PRS2-like protein [Burkholderia pseudomallei]CAJ9933631.1 PRS2-like protein [Burkholderia pseudomallei]CAK0002692.1 PRS2-like protein [Burkholderia pseudomallei]CFL60548.1 PRS2-like protein [Burkholderia pseudomallei]
MRTLVDQLAQYAAYHRDARNIATHLVGIPMIVVAVTVLLSRPTFGAWGAFALTPAALVALTPAALVALAAALFYLRLDLRFGVAMAALLALSLWAGRALAAQTTAFWLGTGLGLFFVGWVIQFVGHYFEGRKPAFVDDLIGLIVGPLFVVAEVAFFAGLRGDVRDAVERRVGPVRVGARNARV